MYDFLVDFRMGWTSASPEGKGRGGLQVFSFPSQVNDMIFSIDTATREAQEAYQVRAQIVDPKI